ncbi:hypothetical protein SISNIDRAFT_413577 [Sistotremastrum niveocremeum HHB9708]|uniref:Uncharacterized protein n=1 Tax=Sistotremastrum niveocremeum HHB9708 TaxID=1314777 RepID=A0A164SV30_9AGAM|nr:hypothetical protein SISNIDRAFT_413577 [Sistotremastrum niveocremeum HHB9708]
MDSTILEIESEAQTPVSLTQVTRKDADAAPPTIPPEASIQLRLRYLEALVYGVTDDSKKKSKESLEKGKEKEGTLGSATLVRKTEEFQMRMNELLLRNDPLNRFMDYYEQYPQYLNPSFALSGITPLVVQPSYSAMSTAEFEALLADIEPEIRDADRDLREIDILNQRGVAGAEYAKLEERLDKLIANHKEDMEFASDIERRVTALLEKYTTRVDSLSEKFIEWNDIVTDAEDRTARRQREQAERQKLGHSS